MFKKTTGGEALGMLVILFIILFNISFIIGWIIYLFYLWYKIEPPIFINLKPKGYSIKREGEAER